MKEGAKWVDQKSKIGRFIKQKSKAKQAGEKNKAYSGVKFSFNIGMIFPLPPTTTVTPEASGSMLSQ